jgi:hypothetical protein
MNTKRILRSLSLVTMLVLVLSVLSVGSVSADSGSASYVYLLGTSFLCDLGPSACPDVAMAANGDTIDITGSGTLSIHPNSVSGGGTFTHHFDGGSLSGTWTAEQLLSFVSYGSSPLFPPEFTAGLALIRVHLVADGGSPQADAILRVTCVLAGATFPSGGEEGVRLNIQDLLNFNEEVSGVTLFIKQ